MSDYTRFRPYRELADYIGTGLLTGAALDAYADAKVSGKPTALVVMGEYRDEHGRTVSLDFGVSREYIESATHNVWDPETKRLRWKCPDCGMFAPKHTKACEYV